MGTCSDEKKMNTYWVPVSASWCYVDSPPGKCLPTHCGDGEGEGIVAQEKYWK